MSSPLTTHAGYCDVDQCSRRCSGRLHNRIPVLSLTDITNWLPEVSILAHSLAVYFEYLVVRSNVTINKLVSDHFNPVAFGE